MQSEEREVRIMNQRSVGFTLIELLVASVLLVVVLLGFFSVLVSSSALDETSQESAVVVNHTRLMAGLIKASAFDGQEFDSEWLTPLDGGVQRFGVPELNPLGNGEAGSVSVSDWSADGVDNDNDGDTDDAEESLLEVTIAIDWMGCLGEQHYEMSFLTER